MDMQEFHSVATRQEGGESIYFDVRPFHDRQAEAVDSFLLNALTNMQAGAKMVGTKPVILLCDSSVQLSASTDRWLHGLRESGIPVDIVTL